MTSLYARIVDSCHEYCAMKNKNILYDKFSEDIEDVRIICYNAV